MSDIVKCLFLLSAAFSWVATARQLPGRIPRRLFKQPDYPPCLYYTASQSFYGDNKAACAPNDIYTIHLARPQQHTAATRVYVQWRQAVVTCLNHTQQDACQADTYNFCMWNSEDGGCSASPNLYQYLFSCTSEYAEAYYYCRIMGDVYGADGCERGPACFWNQMYATESDPNACYPYDLLAENPTVEDLDSWKQHTLNDFLNPDATIELYGNCPESMAFQQAEAYAQTCRTIIDASMCTAMDCVLSSSSGVSVCTHSVPRYYQMLVGGPPSGNAYKQWSLCPRLDAKPKSCKTFNITYQYLHV